MTSPDAREVSKWIDQIQGEIAQLDAELVPLLERQTALAERLGLLKRLLISLAPEVQATVGASTSNGAVLPARSYPTVRDRVQAHATQILAGAEHPLHINEIHAEFIKRGFEVPGAGKPNNITVHLSDATEILSPSRGYYLIRDAGQADSTVRYPVADESRGRRTHG